MDHLHVVLSVAIGGRVRIFPSNCNSPAAADAGNCSHCDCIRMRPADGHSRTDMAIANHARAELEASQSRFPHHKNLHPLDSQHRTALLHPVHHRAAVTGMVRAIAPRRLALSIVCAIKRRLANRSGYLSLPGGTCLDPQSAGDRCGHCFFSDSRWALERCARSARPPRLAIRCFGS